MATQFERFIATMKNVLMLDQADLDFGIYRIMNQKRDQIESYLNNDLRKQVTEAIRENTSNDAEELKKELASLVSTLTAAGMNPGDSPKVKELKERIAQCGNSEDLENEVYSHLSVFFGRYYDGGDFISQRRYKKNVYAIPYEGEEVKLHWANADQYYIKTGEYFRNYRFAIGDDKFCEFTLREASTEQNNNVAQNNMERRFTLCEEEPVEVVGDTLHIYFTYELYPKTTKQKALMEKALDAVKDVIPQEFYSLFSLRPTESDRSRTLLQKHLNDYVARNTFDYFIHKDLGGFLSRELDFYIKNEILVIDDIDARTPDEFLKHLAVIKTIKTVGMKLITFLASLENYQKRLWLKKKFVVQADYCITLDRVPESLYAEIVANDAQREEWVRLFAIDEIVNDLEHQTPYSVPLSVQFLKENNFLVLDTKFFSAEFKNKLLASIDNLDEQCDGVLINSENLQALELLQEKYREQVQCIYIDPPYNTDASKIAYKNGYEHSSWLSLIESRLILAREYMKDTGVIEVAIDDYELRYLNCCIENVFGRSNFISNIAIYTNPKGRDQGYIAQSHDYSIIYAKNKQHTQTYKFTLSAEALAKKYSKTNGENSIRELPLKRTGTGKFREERPYMYFPFIYDKEKRELSVIPESEYKQIYNENTKIFNDSFVEALRKQYEENGKCFILPVAADGTLLRWRWGYKSCNDGCKNGLLFAKKQGDGYSVYQIDASEDKITPKSMWFGERYDASSKGTNILNAMIPDNPFDYPKSLYTVEDSLIIGSDVQDIVMDFFAGSGTTGHACVDLSRKNNGLCRKYILVEMGDYYENTTHLRMEKALYSSKWKSGKPVLRDGISHCFKYMRLEQYEDTLNNLTIEPFNIDKSNVDFYGGYILGYMLDMETRNSLFNMQWFRNPWNMKLRITRQNETREENVDVIETFNYLIGLNVKRIQHPRKGICTVEGVTRRGERTLIIWRDCDTVDNDALNDFFRSTDYATRDTKFDRIYVNGDNNLENLRTEGEQWKVVLTEQEFANRMFEDC